MSVNEKELVRLVGPLKKAASSKPGAAPVKNMTAPVESQPEMVIQTQVKATPPLALDFNPNDLLRGILYAEILSKPRSLARRHR